MSSSSCHHDHSAPGPSSQSSIGTAHRLPAESPHLHPACTETVHTQPVALAADMHRVEPSSPEGVTASRGHQSPDLAHLQAVHSAPTSDRQLYDPEKFCLSPSKTPVAFDNHTHVYTTHDPHEANMRRLKKDLGALVNFMTIVPFVSFAVALYTILVVFIVMILAPLNVCVRSRAPVAAQFRKLLVPASNFHYKCIWSSSRATPANVHRSWPGSIRSGASDEEAHRSLHSAAAPRNASLVAVLLLSPLLSLPMFFAAFVVALWWIMSAITANDVADGFTDDRPRREGQGGFDEGQRLAKGLRHWWIGWLSGDKL